MADQLGLPAVAVYQTDVRGVRPRVPRSAGASGGLALAARASTIGPTARWRRPRRTAAALLAHGIQRVWLWRRGVDTARFHPAKRARRRCAGRSRPDGELLVGYVGRLAVEKRVDLLAAAAGCPASGWSWSATGRRAASLRARAARRGVPRRAPRRAAGPLYASLDVFVHTGPYETFGQTVQEALASGVPVVAPAAGGPLDLVDPGRTGASSRPATARALADAVADLAADPELRGGTGWRRATRSPAAPGRPSATS